MTHSKRPDPKLEDTVLNVDKDAIDEVIAILERVKNIPDGTSVCKLGDSGITDAINHITRKSNDLNIFIDYYIEDE